MAKQNRAIAATLGRTGNAIRWRLRLFVIRAKRQHLVVRCLVLGALFLVLALSIKLVDQPAAHGVDDDSISAIGVYADGYMDSIVEYASGVEPFQSGWSLSTSPGTPWSGRLTWTGLTTDVSTVNVREPRSILITIPTGARLRDDRSMRSGVDGSCASWSDGQRVQSVEPNVAVSQWNGDVVLGCTIPSLGPVHNLFVEIAFEWDSRVRSNSGIGRSRDALTFPLRSMAATDALQALPVSVRELEGQIRQPFELQVTLPQDQKVLDSFPSPDGGTIGKRTWDFSSDEFLSREDLELTTQSESGRVWVSPTTDILLLLGGLFLGLAPSVWRKNG